MHKKIQIAALMLGMSLVFQAKADGVSSEYFHQTDANKFEMTFGLAREPGQSFWTNEDPNGLAWLSESIRNSSSKATANMTPISVTGEYGLNDMFSIGLDLIYGTGSVSISNCPANVRCSGNLTGLFNPDLYLKGKSVMASGTLVYGAIVDLGVQNNHVDSSGNTNNATGSTTLTPFVGWQQAAGPGVWGARFQYDLYKSDQKITNDATTVNSTQAGGNKWSIDTFYEAPMSAMWSLGGSVVYAQAPETKTTAGGTTTSNSDAYNVLMFQLYAPIKLNTQFTLLPNVQYGTLNYSQSTSTAPTETVMEVGLGARYAF